MSRTSHYQRLARSLYLRHSFTCSSHAHKVSSDSLSMPSSTHKTALSHRSLVQVRGEDSMKLLQGLVTADVTPMESLVHSSAFKSLYSMMLNAQGRVLYDVILYHHGDNNDGVLLECDSQATQEVVKHLKRYALRSKVKISCVDEEYKVWALFPGKPETPTSDCYADPRVSSFGTRLITSSQEPSTAGQWNDLNEARLVDYHRHRVEMGIAEGVEEIPVGNCFPLEYNLDYLNGVNFSKGCYLGQELTARTHHTGVVRKRVMPITIDDSNHDEEDMPRGTTISTAAGKSAGKLICVRGQLGLALLRLREISDGGLFLTTPTEKRVNISAHRPQWWPS